MPIIEEMKVEWPQIAAPPKVRKAKAASTGPSKPYSATDKLRIARLEGEDMKEQYFNEIEEEKERAALPVDITPWKIIEASASGHAPLKQPEGFLTPGEIEGVYEDIKKLDEEIIKN